MCINPSIESSSSSSSSSRSDMQITRRLTTSSPARFASQSMPNNANSIDYEGPFISSLSMRERTTFFVIYQFRFRIETVSRRSSLSPLLYYGVRLFRKPRQTPAYIQTALNNHRERERSKGEKVGRDDVYRNRYNGSWQVKASPSLSLSLWTRNHFGRISLHIAAAGASNRLKAVAYVALPFQHDRFTNRVLV